MNEILVSVIIPTYNRTNYVGEAIQSVVDQTYKNIEIIIVDDNANKPDVREYICQLVAKFPQCHLVRNKENLGGALTRNEGIKVSKGDLVSFLDDDDTYEPSRIEKVVNMYMSHKNEKVGIIYTFCNSCDSELNIRGTYKNRPTDNPLYRHMLGCLCATTQWTIPKNVFNNVGYFEQTPCKQDSIMLMKILGEGYKTLCVEECLSNFRVHSDERISGNYESHIVGEKNLLAWQRKYYDKLTPDQIRMAEFSTWRQIMFNYAGARKYTEAFSTFVKVFSLNLFYSGFLHDVAFILLGPSNIRSLKRLFLATNR